MPKILPQSLPRAGKSGIYGSFTFTGGWGSLKLQVGAQFAGEDFIPNQGEAGEAAVPDDVTWEGMENRDGRGKCTKKKKKKREILG